MRSILPKKAANTTMQSRCLVLQVAGTLEVVADHRGDTYRAVYTVKFGDIVYVLHAFQKKSKRGIATPKQEIQLIRARLKLAREHHASLGNAGKGRSS